MACSKCGSNKPNPTCNVCGMSPSVLEIKNPDNYVIFRKVVIPASLGDESVTPPTIGKYRNALVEYQANGHTYLYSSDCMPVALGISSGGIITVTEFPDVAQASPGFLYININDGRARITDDNENWVEVSGGSTGTVDFNELENRPKYNGVEMTGDTNIPDFSSSIQSLSSSLSAETGDRIAADAGLQGSINALANAMDNKVDKVAGKGLSTNDFTTAEKDKLAGIEAGAEVNVQSNWTQTNTTADDYIKNKPDVYTKTEIDAKLTSAMHYKGTVPTVADLPSGASVGDVYNVSDTGINYAWDGTGWDELSGVTDLSNYYTKTETNSLLDNKVDKVTGKGLSTNDFTNADKTKLDGIQAGAEVNVQSDWNQTDSSADDFIKNKPTIPTVPTKTSDLTNDGSDGTSTYVEADDLATVATTGSYNDLSNKPTIPAAQIQSDWNQTNTSAVDYIKNKPNIPTGVTLYNTTGQNTDGAMTQKATTDALDGKQDNLSVSQLATVNSGLTASDKTKLDGIQAGAEVNVQSDWAQTDTTADDYIKNKPTIPAGVTLYNTTGQNTDGAMTQKATTDALDDKVDKVAGKGLSTNDFTTADKTKLDSIAAGAEVNVQSDWSQSDSSADDFIKNKPTNVSSFTNDAGYITSASVPTKTSDLTNDGSDGTSTYVEADDLATVATSGSYNDLSNKPTIPTVNDGTLTITRNNTSVGTFTANQSTNETIDITVPVTAADVSALPSSTKYGASISVRIDPIEYKVTTTLKDQDGNRLGAAQVIDLPLETMVVGGSYDSTNKKIVLTLKNGNTIDIPVADLISGLQTEITSTNKLDADLVDDSTSVNKFTTAADITKLSGIESGAEVNVQANWNESDSSSDAYIQNKPTIPAAQVNSDWNSNSGVSQILNKPNLATVATSGDYDDLTNKPTIPSYSDFTGATSSAAGAHGLVPAPAAGDQDKVLMGDGTWETLPAPELVEMYYGESNAWAKFIAAYQARCIVYCRASSNSNPATGAKTRKAFMAYVNNETAPTEVEFQYYRSVATHTASQQGDQVFVYKLTPANGGTWSVITRNTFTKIVAGTNMTSSYSNGTLTLNAAGGGSTYTAGNGINIANDTISIDDSVVAELSDIPTVNDATLTIQKNGTNVATFTANSSTAATANITVPTDTSDLTNNAGFITSSSLPTKTSDLTNDGSDGSSTYVEADDLASVATSGSYNDLSNKPTIPTVNDATLTIQKNGTNVQTFTANQSTNATANITVPTNTSDLTNDSGFLTSIPTASASTLGGVKVGSNLSIDANGVLSASVGNGVLDITPMLSSSYSGVDPYAVIENAYNNHTPVVAYFDMGTFTADGAGTSNNNVVAVGRIAKNVGVSARGYTIRFIIQQNENIDFETQEDWDRSIYSVTYRVLYGESYISPVTTSPDTTKLYSTVDDVALFDDTLVTPSNTAYVNTNSIVDGAVTTAKISDDAITTPKINTGAVTNAKIDWSTLPQNYSTATNVVTGYFDIGTIRVQYQRRRVTGLATTAGGFNTWNAAWPVAFANSNYTAVACSNSDVGNIAGAELKIITQTANNVTLNYNHTGAIGSSNMFYTVIGIGVKPS